MKMSLKIFCLLSVILFTLFSLYFNLFAQQDSVVIEHISVEQGLSHRNVHCVIVDSQGFLWIGTADGLNRYDGYEFIVYKSNIWDTTSLSSPIVELLVEDTNGNIWIGTRSGLNCYQRKSDSFIRYTHDPQNKYSISDNDNIESLIMDKTNPNYLWIGTDGGGLNLLDIDLQRFYVFKHDSNNINSLSGNKIYSLYQDSYKDFWIGTSDAGMNKINLDSIPKTKSGKYDTSKFSSFKFTRFVRNQDTSSKFNPKYVFSFYEDRSNRIWILGDSRILTFDRKRNAVIPLPYTYNDIDHYHEMIEDNEGRYWFGQHGRVYQLKKGENEFIEYRLNNEQLRSESYQGLYEDNNGNIWAATWDGIYKIYQYSPLFERFVHNPDNSNVSPRNNIYSFLADHSGKLWIGTYSGLLLMDKTNNGLVKFTNYSDLHHLDIGTVWSIVQDQKGLIWFAADYTLLRIDPKDNMIVKYKNNQNNSNCLSFQNKLSWQGETNLLVDEANNLWISAFRGGISKVSLEDLYSTNDMSKITFTNYFNDSDHPACTVLKFIQDRSGFIWICSQNGGVFMFDPKTEIVKSFTQDLNSSQGLNINYVSSVREDNKGNLWFGTYGGGLNKFERDSESFIHYTIKDGLPSDIINNILIDKNENLWIASNSGITKFNPENKTLRNYYVKENQAVFKDTLTGKMYFGNENGFIVFHPDSITASKFAPPVIFTKFTRYTDENEGDKIIDNNIAARDKIELDYSKNLLSFEFAALDFSSDKKYYYAYQLEGLNKNWINIGNKREVTLTNLDPGDYTFKVKACNEDGIWCENYASIGIYISPPWWATWWSYGIYGLLFIGSLYGMRKIEINRRQEKESRRILELENERKTEELEQARELQLSMLPKEIPLVSNLDIAAFMRTATEVGGDYYDFHLNEEKILTAIVGDATGHGLNAGMFVSVSKGLFQNLAQQSDLKDIISQFNTSLFSMKLQPMYMSLNIIRIQGNQLHFVGAGMPPALYFSAEKSLVEEIESSGPPLGGFPSFNYEIKKYEFSKGDILVIMTDGFSERMNDNKQIYGWNKGSNLLLRNNMSSANEIINKFVEVSDTWGAGKAQDDDITFVVIKVK